MSLELVLNEHLQKLLAKGPSRLDDQSVRSARLTLLSRVATFLQIPLDPAELAGGGGGGGDDRLVLSDEALGWLDEAWHRIMGVFSDYHATPQERLVRRQVFLHAPHYVDRRTLSKFIALLAKRDIVQGFYATAAARGGTAQASSERVSVESSDEPRNEGFWEPLEPATAHLKCNSLNRLLAVDGFHGLSPYSYKYYVSHLNDRLSTVEKKHVRAVRALYTDEPLGVVMEGRYSGTFYASCVFLALLELYFRIVSHCMDDFVRSVATRAIDLTTRFVRDNDEENEFRSDRHFRKLADLYVATLRGKEEATAIEGDSILEWMAMDKLKELAKYARLKR